MIMRNKNRWFKIIAIALPFIFIFIAEVLLRIGGYGQDYRLFITSGVRPGYLVMNPAVSEKYFSRKKNATIGYFEPFKRKKSEGTFRVFVMGASTAVGYPYFHNGSFHRMLKFLLQKTYSELDIEVINTSLTAINSYTLLDFANRIVHYEPDAVLIYAGHNEYYGALGAGSTGFLGHWPAIIQFTLRIRQLRLWQLFENAFQKIASWKKPVSLQENLMKRMAGERLVPFKSPVFQAGLQQYKSNLNQILSVFDRAGIPVFISNVVSNEKDQRPLVSKLQAQTDSLVFFPALRKMQKAFEADNWDAVEKYGQLLEAQDSTYAETYYLLARMALEKGQPEKARHYFVKATQHDNLRFRAPIEINHIIRDLSQNTNADFVDVKSAFESKSPQGILGQELILEHLHPNLEGYAVMAETFYKAILERKLIKSPPQPAVTPEVWNEYPLTEVDTLFGTYEIQILKERWPFYEKIKIDTSNRTIPEAVAGALVVKQLSWDQAMERLYQFYHQKNDFENTLRVAEAVIMEHPHQAAFYAKAGSICLRLKYFGKGAVYFQMAYSFEPSPEYARFAALCLVHQNELTRAVESLTSAAKDGHANQKTVRLLAVIKEIIQIENSLKQASSNVQLLNQLAGRYFVIGLEDKAKTIIAEALVLAPSNSESVKLLQRIDQKYQ